MDSYIYLHITADTHEVFYVGQGVRERDTHTYNRTRIWHNVSKKHGYYVMRIMQGLTREQANYWEKFYIRAFGRRDLHEGNLVNLTDGGDVTGRYSELTREKHRKNATGVKFTDERRKKISESLRKTLASPELRRQISHRNLERWSNPEYKLKTSQAMRKPKKRIPCVHCHREMPMSHLKRHGHLDGRCIIGKV
jgi:hypothetical protein